MEEREPLQPRDSVIIFLKVVTLVTAFAIFLELLAGTFRG
ncbi:MAG: hypothetical protein JWN51_3515 [Phycisphaerales bacterium]|nr:hypothetical protein [Phycisphaerales bacterium]